MAIAATARAKMIAITMAVKIFGVADGFRPKAVMLANALAMMTKIGPMMHRLKIRTSAAFRDIPLLRPQSF